MGFDTSNFTKAVQGRMHYALQWQTWAYSLVAGTIGGGCQALIQVGMFAIAASAGANVRVLNWSEIKLTFISGAMTFLVGYLAKSPLPPLEQVTSTTTVTDTHVEQTKVSPPPADSPKP